MAFFDLTDTLAGGADFRYKQGDEKNGLVIQFYHVPTLKKHKNLSLENTDLLTRSLSSATFKAFLTNFKDNFKVNWNQKETFGRMDAIQTFKNTQRQISISFEVPSHSEDESSVNSFELQKLIMMQYPTYETIYFSSNSSKGNASTQTTAADKQITNPSSGIHKGRFISSPPLVYVRFANWIIGEDSTNENKNKFAPNSLVGIISEVSFSPDLEQGFFINKAKPDRDQEGNLISGGSTLESHIIQSKLFTVDLTITIIHTQELGWVERTINGDKLPAYFFGEPKTIITKNFEVETYPYRDYRTTGSFGNNSNTNEQLSQQSKLDQTIDALNNAQGLSGGPSEEFTNALNEVKPRTPENTVPGGLELRGDVTNQQVRNTPGLQQINRETDAAQAETDLFNMLEANQQQRQQQRQEQRKQNRQSKQSYSVEQKREQRNANSAFDPFEK